LSEEDRDNGAAIKKAIEGVISDLVFELQSEPLSALEVASDWQMRGVTVVSRRRAGGDTRRAAEETHAMAASKVRTVRISSARSRSAASCSTYSGAFGQIGAPLVRLSPSRSMRRRLPGPSRCALPADHGLPSRPRRGGLEIPPIVNAATEFGNGAKSINPSIKYVQAMTGDLDDVAKAKEAALAAAAGGADIHYAALTLGMRGLEQAVSEKGGHIIGSYSDKCGVDARYAAFTITGVGFMMETAISETLAGTWKPNTFRPFGLKAGHRASGIVVCNATPDIKAKLDQIEQDLISGKIKTLDA
jgi:hypothetical protein